MLYEDGDGSVYDVDLPLTSNVNVRETPGELGLPQYQTESLFEWKKKM